MPGIQPTVPREATVKVEVAPPSCLQATDPRSLDKPKEEPLKKLEQAEQETKKE